MSGISFFGVWTHKHKKTMSKRITLCVCARARV